MSKARNISNNGGRGTTSNRPASPSVGDTYYDTTLGQMVIYGANSSWNIAATSGLPIPIVTGGTLTSDSTYYYRAFTTSGTLAVSVASLTADILVVAGGGGGGANNGNGGSGGGAGGLVGYASQTMTIGTYAATVGAGGVGAIYNSRSSTSGVNSQLGSLTAAVGGGNGQAVGATMGWEAGGNGGSGGGGGIAAVGSGTAGQGNNGGGVYNGGGGGAGAVGQNGVSGGGSGGAGGNGATYNTTVGGSAGPYAFIDAMGAATSTGQLSSSHYYYAGGGGAVNSSGGGLGGGGGQSTSGTINTGGGGGGTNSSSTAGGSGGSGIVIVRYTRSQVGG
jgi:hypothetical protein